MIRAGILLMAASLSCAADPVRERQIATLGGETPGVPHGPLHRPGQPCGLCHGADGPTIPLFRWQERSTEARLLANPSETRSFISIDSTGDSARRRATARATSTCAATNGARVWPLWSKVEYKDANGTTRAAAMTAAIFGRRLAAHATPTLQVRAPLDISTLPKTRRRCRRHHANDKVSPTAGKVDRAVIRRGLRSTRVLQLWWGADRLSFHAATGELRSGQLGARAALRDSRLHGGPARNFRVYGKRGLRANGNDTTSAANDTNESDVEGTYELIVSIDPEVLSRVFQEKGRDPERWIVVSKARGLEKHVGGTPFAEGSAGDRCLVSWVGGALDPAACASDVFGPTPRPGETW